LEIRHGKWFKTNHTTKCQYASTTSKINGKSYTLILVSLKTYPNPSCHQIPLTVFSTAFELIAADTRGKKIMWKSFVNIRCTWHLGIIQAHFEVDKTTRVSFSILRVASSTPRHGSSHFGRKNGAARPLISVENTALRKPCGSEEANIFVSYRYLSNFDEPSSSVLLHIQIESFLLYLHHPRRQLLLATRACRRNVDNSTNRSQTLQPFLRKL
jgi:hypothetical protein